MFSNVSLFCTFIIAALATTNALVLRETPTADITVKMSSRFYSGGYNLSLVLTKVKDRNNRCTVHLGDASPGQTFSKTHECGDFFANIDVTDPSDKINVTVKSTHSNQFNVEKIHVKTTLGLVLEETYQLFWPYSTATKTLKEQCYRAAKTRGDDEKIRPIAHEIFKMEPGYLHGRNHYITDDGNYSIWFCDTDDKWYIGHSDQLGKCGEGMAKSAEGRDYKNNMCPHSAKDDYKIEDIQMDWLLENNGQWTKCGPGCFWVTCDEEDSTCRPIKSVGKKSFGVSPEKAEEEQKKEELELEKMEEIAAGGLEEPTDTSGP